MLKTCLVPDRSIKVGHQKSLFLPKFTDAVAIQEKSNTVHIIENCKMHNFLLIFSQFQLACYNEDSVLSY